MFARLLIDAGKEKSVDLLWSLLIDRVVAAGIVVCVCVCVRARASIGRVRVRGGGGGVFVAWWVGQWANPTGLNRQLIQPTLSSAHKDMGGNLAATSPLNKCKHERN